LRDELDAMKSGTLEKRFVLFNSSPTQSHNMPKLPKRANGTLVQGSVNEFTNCARLYQVESNLRKLAKKGIHIQEVI
jgi:hypothetical protein